MTTGSQIAARVAALCLNDSGELALGAYPAMAIRAALLVDLGQEGRLTQTAAEIEIDTTPIGSPPADQALAELASLDGHSLEWWLDRSRIGLTDLAEAEVATGDWLRTREARWHRAPRYAVGATTRRDRDVDMLTKSLAPQTAGDVAVLGIAVAAGIADARTAPPGDTLLSRTGDVRWLCERVGDHLREARITGNAVGRATWSAMIASRP